MPPRSTFWSQLKGYADSLKDVSERLQTSRLATLKDQVNQHLHEWFPALGDGKKEVHLGHRRFRVLKSLGQGGYSTVYLVEEVTSFENQGHGTSGPRFALKEVITQGQDQLLEAEREIEVMKSLGHPKLMPILDQATVSRARGQARYRIVYMLFPLYEGNMWDYVERRVKENDPLTLAEVLNVFIQLCHALKAMHTARPPIAHRDVKPHNLLWTDSHKEGGKDVGQFTDGLLDSAHFVARASDNSSTANDYKYAKLPIKVVLMDFGSAGPATVQVDGRSEALALQEDAERHCTAPYRSPELWDVASSCTISEKIDVWSAGCVLYYLMVGQSPFEKTASEAGGSLMLAIVNGQYTWPDEVKRRYPPAMRDVVAACLEVNPAVRPSIDQICSVVERLIDETL